MDFALILIQVVLLASSGFTLWQIWNYLHSEALPDDEPLGEERAKYITDRLDRIKYLLIAEVAVFVIKTVLDCLELFQ